MYYDNERPCQEPDSHSADKILNDVGKKRSCGVNYRCFKIKKWAGGVWFSRAINPADTQNRAHPLIKIPAFDFFFSLSSSLFSSTHKN